MQAICASPRGAMWLSSSLVLADGKATRIARRPITNRLPALSPLVDADSRARSKITIAGARRRHRAHGWRNSYSWCYLSTETPLATSWRRSRGAHELTLNAWCPVTQARRANVTRRPPGGSALLALTIDKEPT